MRTGERGIFPAFYAHEVIGQSKELLGECKDTAAYFFFFAFLFETHRTITFSMHITLRRNEKESSVDWNFQCAVFGVCWGTLSPRQRHSLCCYAEGKKSTFTLLLLWIVYYGQDTNVVSLCVRLQYRENGRYMCDLPLYVSWRLACKESNWLWAWRMNMNPLMRYKTNKHKWHDYSGNRLSLCFGIMLHCFISDWTLLFFCLCLYLVWQM